MNKTKMRFVTWLLAGLVLAACTPHAADDQPTGNDGQDSTVSLDGSEWVLLSLNGQPPVAQATIQFADGQAGGTTGCNHYGGSYQASDDTLTIGQMMMTEMYCVDEGVMEQEQAFTVALGTVTGYRLAAERLELLDAAGNVVLVFAPPAPPPAVTLEGTDWSLTTFVQGETASSLLSGTSITLRLEDGQLQGSAGCNNYIATYTPQDGALTISPPGSTRQYCAEPAGVMEQETLYLNALANVVAWQIDAGQLTLSTADGQQLVLGAQ